MQVPLCLVDEIPADGVLPLSFLGRSLLAVKVDGTPRAMLTIRLAPGGPLTGYPGRAVAEWHRAKCANQTGTRRGGPARSAARLITLPTRVEDGILFYVFGESRRTVSKSGRLRPPMAH